MNFAIAIGAILAAAALAFVITPLVRDRDDGAHARMPTAAPPAEVDAEELIRRHRDARTSCPDCGPRPESGAAFCSSCGRYLAGRCVHCGSEVHERGASWCSACGGGLSVA